MLTLQPSETTAMVASGRFPLRQSTPFTPHRGGTKDKGSAGDRKPHSEDHVVGDKVRVQHVSPPSSRRIPASLLSLSVAASSPAKLARSLFRPSTTLRSRGARRGSRMSIESYVTAVESIASGSGSANVLQFLHESCPDDVLGRVLCYAGPRKAKALSQTNRYFRDFMNQEQVWRVFCEEFSKWRHHDPGQDSAEPASWKDHYYRHPCVPVDYDTIEGALASVTYGCMKQVRDICVLLPPGSIHQVKHTLCIDTSHSGIVIRIETVPAPTGKNPIPAIVVSALEDHPYHPRPLKMHTTERDLPLFKVVQGELHLSNLEVRHSSAGSDIWNGNAAIHIEPHSPDVTLRPTRVCLRAVNVTSETGRGVVLRGDARLSIFDSYIHHCAGTGIYVGFSGNGSLDHLRHPTSPLPDVSAAVTNADNEVAHEDTYRAVVRDTDIVENGVGSRRGPVGRGHSGVYLEEGCVELSRCSVVRNSSSGICVAASSSFQANDNASGVTRLDMSHCYLVNNGGTPLEVTSVERHRLHQNVLSFTGVAPVFSSVFGSALSDRDSEDESEVQEL